MATHMQIAISRSELTGRAAVPAQANFTAICERLGLYSGMACAKRMPACMMTP